MLPTECEACEHRQLQVTVGQQRTPPDAVAPVKAVLLGVLHFNLQCNHVQQSQRWTRVATPEQCAALLLCVYVMQPASGRRGPRPRASVR